MANPITSFKTDFTVKGRAKITITTKEGKNTFAFEQNNIDDFAAVCSILSHPKVTFEMSENGPRFISRS